MSDLTDKIAAEHEYVTHSWYTGDGDQFTRPGCVCTDEPVEDYTAHLAEVTEAAVRAQIAADIEAERNRYRQAHQSAVVDHFAHDYCRWVGGAEALTQAAADIAKGGA